MDKLIYIFGKAATFAIGILVAIVALFRGVVVFLWGSHSDLGLFAAPFVAVIGLCIILYIAAKAFDNIKNDLVKLNSNEKTEN